MSVSPLPLEQALFQNSFVEALVGDDSLDHTPRQLPGVHYARVRPTPVARPQLLAWSDDLAAQLGLARPPRQGAAVDLLAGNAVAASMQPFAARYGGHQFGQWAGQLGDGRALSLGELLDPQGRPWELQLKGAGPTPFSRRADGRAVLRSSVREFLCSEAMHHLGVPTTRALSLVSTGEAVVRDMFYDGNPRPEPGAIVARVAPTFVRFGNFQLLAAHEETDNLRQLADYVIQRYFPELGHPAQEGPEIYGRWLAEIARRTGVLVAHWQTVGFVHGVLNTDNMSILGLTIDYGPYGWLEPYDLTWTPNTTDFGSRRYAFGQQPQVGLWNLMALAQALVPLVPDAQATLRPALDRYAPALATTQHQLMLRKLGLTPGELATDHALLQDLPAALATAEADFTIFFRQLSHLAPRLLAEPVEPAGPATEAAGTELLAAACYSPLTATGLHQPLRTWLDRYWQRLRQETRPAEAIGEGMRAANPKYVLRNYLAQQAAEAAEEGDLAPLERLLAVLRQPFAEQPAHEALAARRPLWARDKPGAATLSCSS